jgi:hypothetical protein
MSLEYLITPSYDLVVYRFTDPFFQATTSIRMNLPLLMFVAFKMGSRDQCFLLGVAEFQSDSTAPNLEVLIAADSSVEDLVVNL